MVGRDEEDARCVNFDPLDLSFSQNPYDKYRELRDLDPVHRLDGYGAWIITRYEDVAALMRSPDVTTDIRIYSGYLAPKDGADLTPTEWFTTDAVLRGDQARQQRLRRLTARVFSPRAVARQGDLMAELASKTLALLPLRGEIDAVRDFALPFPPQVVASVLGVPIEDAARFCGLARNFISITNPIRTDQETAQLDHTIAELRGYIYGLIEACASGRGSNFLFELLVQEQEGARFTTDEVAKLSMSLLAAGIETMASLIAVGVLTLFSDARLRSSVTRRPDLLPAFVDELLRHQMIGKFIVRFAAKDLVLRGRRIARGDLIFLCPPAAQRDPRHSINPDVFDVARDNSGSLAFGIGSHYCVGAALARAEGITALTEMLKRYPDAQLAIDPEEIVWTNELFGRRPVSLPMVV